MAQQTASTSNTSSNFTFSAGAVFNWLVDLIFPPRCGNCGRVDFRFCGDCLGRLAALPLDVTTVRQESLDGLCGTGVQAGILENAVKSFKYHDALNLCAPLADRLSASLSQQNWRIDAIVPVPLHSNRESERGYNQAELLSRPVAQATGIPCEPTWLRRIRDTSQQAQLAAVDRRQNVADAFQASAEVAGKSILLVDDVVTTGSTLGACAGALRTRNAESVFGICVSTS
ncbi:MAG: ComF family protein [Chloroflexi bacterium]|nr:ComF family protein [Chloroflexota bacterium]